MLDAKENLKDAQSRQRDDEEDKALVWLSIWMIIRKFYKINVVLGTHCQIGKISTRIQKVDGKERRLYSEEEGENPGR